MNTLEEIESFNHHLRLALNQVSEGILVIEAECNTPIGPRIVFSNQAMWDFTGYEKADIVGQPLGLLFDRDHLPEFINQLPVIAADSNPHSLVKDLHLKNGEREQYEWVIVPVKNNIGEVINFTIRVSPLEVDKTEGRKSVEEVFQGDLAKSRLESLQIVSSGIAHDFRNGLVATKLAVDLVRMSVGDNEEALKYLADADLSLDANAELATQMLEFTRGEESKMKVVNLHGLLQKTARMSTVGNNVTPELSIQQDLWDVRIDSVQMRQVFQNIIINGCQAMPSGGPMNISARNATVAEGNTFGLSAGDYVVIGIRDRGCGIPKDSIGKVFDPYFTTKPDGTGIGLASCKQIVERHRGKIMVESAENVGSEFIIFLPVAVNGDTGKVTLPNPQQVHARATEQFLREAEPDNAIRPKRILVVDDDAQIRKLASTMAEHLGLESDVAEDGEQAIHLVRQSFRENNSFSIVLLDLGLPRMGGVDVMREIRKIDSEVKIVLSTGDVVGEADSSEWDGVLSKPYGKDAMESVLTRVLQASHHQLPKV